MSQESSPVIPDSKYYHFVEGMGTSGHGSTPELNDIMMELLKHVHNDAVFKDTLSGWFIGSDEIDEDKVRNHTTANGNSVRIEPHEKDEVIILGLKLPEDARLFTLSFSFETRYKENDKIGWTVWDYHLDDEDQFGKVGEIHIHSTENSTSQSPSGSITLDFGAYEGDFLTGDYVFIMWNTQASEDFLQINQIEASYENTDGDIVPYTIPEPTTATLSLLALAGLAARRRRK